MKNHKEEFSLERMARMLGVCRSRFYSWEKNPFNSRFIEDLSMKVDILDAYDESKHRSGSPKIRKALLKKGRHVSQRRVLRLMREEGLYPKIRKKYRVTTDSKHDYPTPPNLVARDFTAQAPNEKWVSDITYIRAGRRWWYLCVFIDLYSRKVVGWSFSASLKHDFVISALRMAVNGRQPLAGLIVHSDRGVQYACDAFRLALRENKIIRSMSRKGNCWDNAVAESFFHSLKSEIGSEFQDEEVAYREIFEYIEIMYNKKRLHSTLGYCTPDEFEGLGKCA
jgi:putative transposase